ncbi:MAG: hypothetical protein H8E14_14310 [Candidatus Marinimicrobia bacterium]|nr:hypothetical protein [Candidatus Neomarinimicrobiota bacterium]
MHHSKNLTIFGGLLILSACASAQPEPISKYENEIREWHAKRIERLKQPDSWLSLAGNESFENMVQLIKQQNSGQVYAGDLNLSRDLL